MMKRLLLPLLAFCTAAAQSGAPVGKFQQLEQMLPTPNGQRIASGAAGTGYWQNTADYVIDAELDDVKRSITAKATVSDGSCTFSRMLLRASKFESGEEIPTEYGTTL